MTILSIAGVIVAIGGASTYWTAWGWPVPSTRGYVEYRVNPIELAQGRYDEFIQDSQLNQTQAEITKWKAELPRIGNQQTRTLIETRIKTLEAQADKINADMQARRQRK